MGLGIYHEIDLPTVEVVLDQVVAGRDRKDIRATVLEQFAADGIAPVSAVERWKLAARPAYGTTSVHEHVRKYWNVVNSSERKELAICAAIASFPLLAESLDVLIQITTLRKRAKQSEIRARLVQNHGARRAVTDTIQKTLQSARRWGLIENYSPGVHRPRTPKETTSVVGSAAIGAYLLHAEMDSVRLENLTSSSILSLWDFSDYAPDGGQCIELRVGALGREYVLSNP